MTIHDVKNDPIFQVSNQEPSTSSKYDFKDENLNFAHKWLITYDADPWYHGQHHPPITCWGTIDYLQVWTLRTDRGSWHSYARELKFGTQVNNHISRQSMDDAVLQVSGEKPSMSPNFGLQGQGFLEKSSDRSSLMQHKESCVKAQGKGHRHPSRGRRPPVSPTGASIGRAIIAVKF